MFAQKTITTDSPLEDIGLKGRPLSALHTANITTVGQLTALTIRSLGKIVNMGVTNKKLVKKALEDNGLKLAARQSRTR